MSVFQWKGVCIMAAACGAVLGLSTQAEAQTMGIVDAMGVSSGCIYSELSDAMNAVGDNGTILIEPGTHTITQTGALNNISNVIIAVAETNTSCSTRTTTGSRAALRKTGAGNIADLTNSSVSIFSVGFIGGRATAANGGGGQFFLDNSQVVMNDALLRGGRATNPNEHGGSVLATNQSMLTIRTRGRLVDNQASFGGALAARTNSHIFILGDVIIGTAARPNTATNGGAIFLRENSNLTIDSNDPEDPVRFQSNTADLTGGAIGTFDAGMLMLSGVRFGGSGQGNVAQVSGGAINAHDTMLFIQRSEFHRGRFMENRVMNMATNSFHRGGAIHFNWDIPMMNALSIRDTDFITNLVRGTDNATSGGAVAIIGDGDAQDAMLSPVLENCQFVGNEVDSTTDAGQGGALIFRKTLTGPVINQTDDVLTINRVLFDGNIADAQGGAIMAQRVSLNFGASCPLAQDVGVPTSPSLPCLYFANNKAVDGGAIAISHPSNDVNIERSAFRDNTADCDGSALWLHTSGSQGRNHTILNTLVAGNDAGGLPGCDPAAIFVRHSSFIGSVNGSLMLEGVTVADNTAGLSIFDANPPTNFAGYTTTLNQSIFFANAQGDFTGDAPSMGSCNISMPTVGPMSTSADPIFFPTTNPGAVPMADYYLDPISSPAFNACGPRTGVSLDGWALDNTPNGMNINNMGAYQQDATCQQTGTGFCP